MTNPDFKPAVTIFVLLKTTPEWLAFSPDERFARLGPILHDDLIARRDSLRMRFFDTEFYATRVTDVMMIEASDHHSWELFAERLRETPFWDRWFEIVEILPAVENAYADNYGRQPIGQAA